MDGSDWEALRLVKEGFLLKCVDFELALKFFKSKSVLKRMFGGRTCTKYFLKNSISIREASELLNLHLMKAEQPSDSIKSDLKYS